jgi:hypothetical protein
MLMAVRRRRAFTLFAIPAMISACHSYLPIEGAPAPGRRVAIELTDAGTSELARYVGPRVGAIEGELVGASDSTLALSVIVTRQHNGIESFWNGEQVLVPRAYVSHLSERQLSPTRTVLFASGFTALLAALAVAFSGGFNGGGHAPDSGTGNR